MAAQALTQDRPFIIRGITSRGIFVDLEEKLILFLSTERFRGPLTINLPQNAVGLERIEVKATGQVCQSGLRFSNPDIVIDTLDAPTWSALDSWSPTALPGALPSDIQILNFLQHVNTQIGLTNELIDSVVEILPGRVAPLSNDDAQVSNAISGIYQALQRRDLAQLEAAAHFLAGRGRGLTPSGDDFLLGICYGMFMLQAKFPEFQEPGGILISNKVKQRSTLISANLVECAIRGEVDERLGAAFNTLLHPEISPAAAIRGILSWGSSSGIDATAGMALLLLAMR